MASTISSTCVAGGCTINAIWIVLNASRCPKYILSCTHGASLKFISHERNPFLNEDCVIIKGWLIYIFEKPYQHTAKSKRGIPMLIPKHPSKKSSTSRRITACHARLVAQQSGAGCATCRPALVRFVGAHRYAL